MRLSGMRRGFVIPIAVYKEKFAKGESAVRYNAILVRIVRREEREKKLAEGKELRRCV